MEFNQAVRLQYHAATYYTVWLVGPNGERFSLGSTQRKSGAGLLAKLRAIGWKKLTEFIPGVANTTMTKRADCIHFSNGWRVEFGDTIRQEASR